MYCTLEDLLGQVRKGVLLRVAGDDQGNFQDQVIESGIQQAQNEIDAYCRGQYKVPFASPPPEIIRKLAIDMTLFHIFSGYGFNFASDSSDRIIKVRYDNAIDFLKQVAAGKLGILPGASTTNEDNGVGSGNLRMKSEPRIFGRDRMGSF